MIHGSRDASALADAHAILFDLDGVLTPTAEVHMRAWARLFTPVLAEHGVAPYVDADYFAHIDGKPRYDGVRSMLQARGIELPEGETTDGPEAETVHGLGNRKDVAFNAEVDEHGVEPYAGSVAFLDAAEAAGLQVAVVTSSRNGRRVLAAAGLADRFEVVVDGVHAAAHGLAGKPSPATYLEGAQLLGLAAERCVVVEDAHSGVAAGHAGGFLLTIGVDRGAGAASLLEHGADLVVDDLAELIPSLPGGAA
ncbi:MULTISPECIES: HAD family hydrolase [unclassified Agrococcus]|uniref:HAD family hydrolase n=1 Tax=unclassified Agrococcus TaxID=2615065 RepID=UPI00362007EF